MNRIKRIIRYLPKRWAYVDENLLVWELKNKKSYEIITKETDNPEFMNTGLMLRAGKENEVGINVEQEDLVIVYKDSDEVESFLHHIRYKGIITKGNKIIENLLI